MEKPGIVALSLIFFVLGCGLRKYEPFVLSDLAFGKEPCEIRTQVSQRADGLVEYRTPGSGYQLALSIGDMWSGSKPCMGPGAEHQYIGKVTGDVATLEGDPSYPLTFKAISGKGYVHLCGRGTVKTATQEYKLGQNDTIADWLSRLNDAREEVREGAVMALGWLGRPGLDSEKIVSALIPLLKDPSLDVQRDAAEALGKLGNVRTLSALDSWADPIPEYNDVEHMKQSMLKDVADEAVWLIIDKMDLAPSGGYSANSGDMPAWLPAYPNAANGKSGIFQNGKRARRTFETGDPLSSVETFFMKSIETAGLSITSRGGTDQRRNIFLRNLEKGIRLEILLSEAGAKTLANIRYSRLK